MLITRQSCALKLTRLSNRIILENSDVQALGLISGNYKYQLNTGEATDVMLAEPIRKDQAADGVSLIPNQHFCKL